MTADEQAQAFRIWQSMLDGDSSPYIAASERVRAFIDDERRRMRAAGESPTARNPFDGAAQQPEAQTDPLAAPDHVLETGTAPLADDAATRLYADYYDAKEVTA